MSAGDVLHQAAHQPFFLRNLDYDGGYLLVSKHLERLNPALAAHQIIASLPVVAIASPTNLNGLLQAQVLDAPHNHFELPPVPMPGVEDADLLDWNHFDFVVHRLWGFGLELSARQKTRARKNDRRRDRFHFPV